MRVMIVALCRQGGTLRLAGNLADALDRRVDVHMVASASAEVHLLPKRAPYSPIRTGATVPGNLRSTLNPLSYLRVQRVASRFSPDVIHFPVEHAWNGPLQMLLRNYPLVQTIHDPERHLGDESRIDWALDRNRRLEVSLANRLIVLSRVFRSCFSDSGIPAEQVDCVPHGAFHFKVPPCPAPVVPPIALTSNVLFCGRILEYKGLDLLVRAMSKVQQVLPHASLTIAGSGDLSSSRSRLARLANVKVMNRQVTELEMYELHRQCDLVAAPFTDASQSGVVSLALTNGRPVVTTRVGGIPEQLRNGVDGLVVEPGDPSLIADAILSLLQEPERLKEMGRRASEHYRDAFNWKGIADQTLDTYRRAIGDHEMRTM